MCGETDEERKQQQKKKLIKHYHQKLTTNKQQEDQEEEDKDDDEDNDENNTYYYVNNIDPSQTVAGQEMKTHIEKLQLRSIARTRDYFLSKIAELRKTKTNIGMIQIISLLKYSPLMHFLADAAPTIHTEIRITPYFVGFIHRAHGISKPFDVKSVMVN